MAGNNKPEEKKTNTQKPEGKKLNAPSPGTSNPGTPNPGTPNPGAVSERRMEGFTGKDVGMAMKQPDESVRDADGDIVLCAVSAYEEKYYFNPQFSKLPESIQDELRTICILFVEDVGGRFVMAFDDEGSLLFKTDGDETDYNYDEIGAGLLVKQLQRRRQELFESLELFCRVVIFGQEMT